MLQQTHDDAGEKGAQRYEPRRRDKVQRREYKIGDYDRGVRAELFFKRRLQPSAEKSFFDDGGRKPRGSKVQSLPQPALVREFVPRPIHRDDREEKQN